MPALLFGSIGTLAETSRLQLDSFNDAFAEAGLDWHWSEDEYRGMLADSGGAKRVAAYADARGETVDADAIHARKSALFQQRLARGIDPRPGVEDTMKAARDNGWRLALVSTTSPGNIESMLAATGLSRDRFDLILDAGQVTRTKPDPEPYTLALSRLDIPAGDAVAVEDNPDGLTAAREAGIRCLAFPGAFHDPEAFGDAPVVSDRLTMQAVETR